MNYKRSEVRKLIEALTEPELSESLDDFPEVRKQFSDGQQKYQRVNIILDYFEKHQNENGEEGFQKFLSVIKKNNSEAYKDYFEKTNSDKNTEILSLLDIKREEVKYSKLIDNLKAQFPQEDELFWQCVKQVYQDFLLQLEDEDDSNNEPENLDEILYMLKDCPEQTVISLFIPRLIAYLSIKEKIKYQAIIANTKKVVRDNLPEYKIYYPDFTKSIEKFAKEYRELLNKSYLIVAIKENNSHPNTFQIFGWLATDEIIENPDLDFSPLKNQLSVADTEDCRTQEQHYKLENLKEIVRGFINQIVQKSERVRKLIVEIFLPSSLFGWDVDKWELETSNQICLGVVHEVRIRSLDRLNPRYNLYREKWEKKWRTVQKCRNPLRRFFPSHCTFDINTLTGQLQDEQILGLKLKSALKSGHEGIASALYYSGTPIALWFRCDPQGDDCETQLNNLLQDRLLQLPNRVFRERCQPQCHISLIWDNPNRLIPNYQLK